MLVNGSTIQEIYENRIAEGTGFFNWEEDYFEEKWLHPAYLTFDNYPSEADADWWS
jgi:hypothetical protein